VHRLALLAAIVSLPACAKPPSPTAELSADLAALLDSTVRSTAELPGAMLRVEAPSLGFSWTKAAGLAQRGGDSLRADQTFRVASMTKTYVAAAILRLVEQGKLELDAPIARHILPASVTTIAKDGYDANRITVRMLLQHTSGLFDFATQATASGSQLQGGYSERVMADPKHRWTRAEQLQLAIEVGAPYGQPGEVYHYSDTGYILLGEILETVTGLSMQQAVRDLVGYQRLGVSNTYFETLEPVPTSAGPRVHQYMGAVDANDFDASIDLYGGGGLVSDLPDLATFFRALVRGEVLERRATLDSMLAPTPQSAGQPGVGYGMGIGRGEADGVVCYGHGGFWGTLARHCPELDITVVGAVTNNEANAALRALTQGAIRRVADAVKQAARS